MKGLILRQFKTPHLRDRIEHWNKQGKLLPISASQTFRGFYVFLTRANPPLIWIDGEHDDGEWSLANLRAAVCAAENTETLLMVRPKRADTQDVRTILDFGADGIMFPQLSNPEQVRAAISLTKYKTKSFPAGNRGFGGVMANHFDESDPDYPDRANSNIFCSVQIETREAVENIDAIVEVPGIDMLFVGPGDLAMQLGTPGNQQSDEMMAALKKILKAAAHNNLPVATTPIFGRSPEDLQKLKRLGFAASVYAGDIGLVVAGCALPEQLPVT